MGRSCMYLRLRRSILVTAVLLGFCATAMHAQGTVKAVLFPYIPDAAGDDFRNLKEMLQNEFSNATRGKYNATITIDPKLNLYSMKELEKLLHGQEADVVEVDTLLLGDLVRAKLVAKLPDDLLENILPNAQTAAKIDNALYAVPTYLCTNVVYTHAKELTSVKGGKGLGKFLTDIPLIPLVGNYKGSFTSSPTYLDAWADTHCTTGIPNCTEGLRFEVSKGLVDQETMSYFRPLVEICATHSRINPCLSGAYKDNHNAEAALVAQQANGYVGFTEGLFYILSTPREQPPVNVVSAPLGKKSHPVMFVDALVVSSKCQGACFARAVEFIKFMSATKTRELIAFSADAGKEATPRYLLQANQSFYERKPAVGNQYYRRFKEIIDEAAPFPNDVISELYKTLSAEVLNSLTSTQNPPN